MHGLIHACMCMCMCMCVDDPHLHEVELRAMGLFKTTGISVLFMAYVSMIIKMDRISQLEIIHPTPMEGTLLFNCQEKKL